MKGSVQTHTVLFLKLEMKKRNMQAITSVVIATMSQYVLAIYPCQR